MLAEELHLGGLADLAVHPFCTQRQLAIGLEGPGLHLGTGTTTPTKTDTDVTTEDTEGRLAVDSGYPQTDDPDTDNTLGGVDVVTWRYSYGTTEGNITDIAELAIVDVLTAATAALCHALFGSTFTKTSSDTLKVFVNHTFNGT